MSLAKTGTRIFKYPIEFMVSHVKLPEGATVLAAARQGAVPHVWALVDMSAPQVECLFVRIAEGDPRPTSPPLAYIASYEVEGPGGAVAVEDVYVAADAGLGVSPGVPSVRSVPLYLVGDYRMTVDLPLPGRPVSVGIEANLPCVWMTVGPSDAPRRWTFYRVLTGHGPPDDGGEFLGTVQTTDTDGSPYVAHVFARPEAPAEPPG